jgi:hypothetical protein
MPKVSLLVDQKTLADANAAVSRNLIVPENAVRKTTKDGETAKWNEELEITGSSIKPSERKKDTMTILVQTQVVVDKDPDNVNAGRKFGLFFDVTPKAFHNSDHEFYKANNQNIGRLNALLRALNLMPEAVDPDEMLDYGDFFSADDGDNAPVVGLRVVALIRQRPYNGKEYQNADEFIAVA